MSIKVNDYWGTLSGSQAELQSMWNAQLVFGDNMIAGSTSQSVISRGLQNAASDPILQALVGLTPAGVVAATFYNVLLGMDASANDTNNKIIVRGRYVLQELINILKGNPDYSRLEATVFFREYEDRVTGNKMRVVYGNSTTLGQNSGAYKVNRIKLKNGSWLE